MSRVAGILDKKGGFRVVVTERRQMKHHLGEGERLFLVPDLIVQEPVAWNDIPQIIDAAHAYANKMAAPSNVCGECVACCRIPFIRIDADSGGGTCHNCLKGGGCRIYVARPKPCREFECWWLRSQQRNDKMPPELRPDRCGVVFTDDTVTSDPLLFEVHRDPSRPQLVDEPIVVDFISEMQSVGYKAKLITHYLADE